jgi:hypothetical protein
MSKTRRYSIEIKDVATKKAVMFTVVDWDAQDLRAAIAQNMRLACPPTTASSRKLPRAWQGLGSRGLETYPTRSATPSRN